jgi:hypothetical protein
LQCADAGFQFADMFERAISESESTQRALSSESFGTQPPSVSNMVLHQQEVANYWCMLNVVQLLNEYFEAITMPRASLVCAPPGALAVLPLL